MTKFKPVLEVLNKYGLELRKKGLDNSVVMHIEKTFNSFFVFEVSKRDKLDFKEEKLTKEELVDHIAVFELFDQFSVTIADFSKWLETFGIQRGQLPLPEHYVKTFPIRVDSSSEKLIVGTFIFTLPELTHWTKIETAQMCKELYEPFSLLTLFHPEQAKKESEEYIVSLIEQLDVLLVSEHTESFKRELADAILKSLDLSEVTST